MPRALWLVLCAWCCVLGARGGDLLVVKEDVFIETRHSQAWKFPAVDATKGRIVVAFNNRIDYPRNAGWCPCWQIEVNGRLLTASATRNETRLLNKPYRLKHKWFGEYRADTGADKWFALYAPEYHSADGGFEPAAPEASHYVIDISDAVRPDGENVLRFNASSLSRDFYISHHVTDRKPAVVFGHLNVRQESAPTRLPAYAPPREVRATRACYVPPKWAFGGRGDEAVVEVNGRRIPIFSRFSVPGGGSVEMGAKKNLATPCYTVTRRFVKRPDRIDVFDTFASTTNALIGVKVRYEMPSKHFEPIYVAGDKNPSAEEFPGGRNPSVLGVCRGGRVSVALLAQDDVFRVQNVQYCKEGWCGLRTDGLALVPGEARTIEWSIYPIGSGDYFDFVNAVRRDWDVNFPIMGSFNLSMNCYKNWNEKSARWNTDVMGLAANSFGCYIWSHLGGVYTNYHDVIWGTGLNASKVRVKLDAEHSILVNPDVVHAFNRNCIAKCRRFTPDVKIFSYLHDQISVDADDEKYEEARMINAKGVKMNYNGGATEKIFVPTETNRYGRDFMKMTDWWLDTLDLDGIYLDEINHCNSRLYYGDAMWDGATVELDAQNNVKRKVSYVCLLKLKFTLGFFDHVINKRGKLMIGNFSPETRSERAFKFPRFEETYSHRWVALSHLYTPIQLGDMLTYANNPKDMAADQRMALKRGALYYHYLGDTGCPSLSSKMFPFTPIELHAGWLVGKERILTCVSGEFGWRGEKPNVKVYVYDQLGRLVPNYPCETVEGEKERVFKLELKPDHCAAIVREQAS